MILLVRLGLVLRTILGRPNGGQGSNGVDGRLHVDGSSRNVSIQIVKGISGCCTSALFWKNFEGLKVSMI